MVRSLISSAWSGKVIIQKTRGEVMAEPEQVVPGKITDEKKALDFVNIVKALRVLATKGEFHYDRINKLLRMAQTHGDCFCESCREERKKENKRFGRSLSKIARFREEYYSAGRNAEFENIVKIAKKAAELLFSFQRAGLDDAELIRALVKIYRKKVIFI
jgi:hypothetical protein